MTPTESPEARRPPSGPPSDILQILADAELGVLNDVHHWYFQAAFAFAGYTSICQATFVLTAEELDKCFFTARVCGSAVTPAPATRAVLGFEFNGTEIYAQRCTFFDRVADRVCRLDCDCVIIPGENAPAAVVGNNTVRFFILADPVAASTSEARTTTIKICKWLGKPTSTFTVVT